MFTVILICVCEVPLCMSRTRKSSDFSCMISAAPQNGHVLNPPKCALDLTLAFISQPNLALLCGFKMQSLISTIGGCLCATTNDLWFF